MDECNTFLCAFLFTGIYYFFSQKAPLELLTLIISKWYYKIFQTILQFFRTLMRALELNAWYWVGLNDKAQEGNFVWLNGNHQPSNDNSIWWPNDPNNYDGADCGAMTFVPGEDNCYRLVDSPCSHLHQGICEIRL